MMGRIMFVLGRSGSNNYSNGELYIMRQACMEWLEE